LRDRWELTLGRSSDKLPALLKTLGPIDIFFHDSEHTYDNMVWEFQTVWPGLKPGGKLLAHNVDKNTAFADFEQTVGGESFKLAGYNNDNHLVVTGGKVK
jgi:predicted O-methyltransferase YrrM